MKAKIGDNRIEVEIKKDIALVYDNTAMTVQLIKSNPTEILMVEDVTDSLTVEQFIAKVKRYRKTFAG
jgi:hypothetical protein